MEKFNEVKQNITDEIDRYFDYAEKERLFIEGDSNTKDIYLNIKRESFLTSIHILIANKIHWFLKFSLIHKQDYINEEIKKLTTKSESIKLSELINYLNKVNKIYKIREAPNKENIERFIQHFNSNPSFSRYDESDAKQPYSSLDAFEKIYKSRNKYAHEDKIVNTLNYEDLKYYKNALYNFMDDVIKILDLPIE